ncbi:MAG: Cytochrome c biosis protein CcdA [Actinomycetota bacterium]|nr:Cytochrome c biosis protein CcdA [Actinomycetota bacterium]
MTTLVGSVVTDGSLLLAIPVAMLAGLVSFLSPCVLPLVPGYLSYITGLTGAELGITAAGPTPATTAGPGAAGGSVAVAEAPTRTAAQSSKVLVGTVGFVAGFSAVFVAYGALFGAIGGWLLEYQEPIQRVLGVLVIAMGLSFAGWLPGLNREYRLHRAPTIGVWGAPALGVLFGLGWTPCIGPTLAAVQTLAFTEGSAVRGAVLSLAYCVGLGVPFVLIGLAFRRLAGALGWVRAHYALVMRIGGVMLIAIGVALVTGVWADLTIWARTWVSGYEVPL